MGRTYHRIDQGLEAFIAAQRVFFVATAPRADTGHVNVSPKGLDTFRVLGPEEVVYLDCNGSGAETIAHVRENGRMTILFCAFEGPPKIVRLHGRAEVVEPGDDPFEDLRRRFPPELRARSVVRMKVERISDSCGFGVPRYDFQGDRRQLVDWTERKGVEGVRAYQREKNARSIDGLPALRSVTPD
jgi:hypothetical protein